MVTVVKTWDWSEEEVLSSKGSTALSKRPLATAAAVAVPSKLLKNAPAACTPWSHPMKGTAERSTRTQVALTIDNKMHGQVANSKIKHNDIRRLLQSYMNA